MLKKQAIILAKFSRDSNWKNDSCYSLFLEKKAVSKDFAKSWIQYIKEMKREDYFF